MATTFREAPEVREIADELIAAHHSHLRGVQVLYVFQCGEVPTRNGKAVLGTARKLTGLPAYLAWQAYCDTDRESQPEDLFLVTICEAAWDGILKSHQKKALVDHELCHIVADEDGNLKIAGHDLEEFRAVVQRHGLWDLDLEHFAKTLAMAKLCQMPLPLDEDLPNAPTSGPAWHALQEMRRVVDSTGEGE